MLSIVEKGTLPWKITCALFIVGWILSTGCVKSEDPDQGKRAMEMSLAKLEADYTAATERMAVPGIDTGTLQQIQLDRALLKSRIERLKAILAGEKLDASDSAPSSAPAHH